MIVLAKRSARWTVVERMVFAGLLALLALVPLPFGADRPWAWSLFSGSVGVLILGWGILAAQSRSYQPTSIRPLLPAIGLFALVAAWIAVQASGLMPAEWRHPLWHAAETALAAPIAGAISIDEHRSWTAMMRLVGYGAVFLLAFQLCMATDRSERLIRMLIGMTLIYACYGLAVQSAGTGMVLWYEKVADVGDLTSTFLDRDAFAAYAGLGLLCALALLFRPTMRRGDLETGWRFATRAIADFFFARSWIVILGVSVLFVTILMTHSPVGLVVSLLGAATYLALMAWVRGRKTVAVVSVAVMAVAAWSLVDLARNVTPGGFEAASGARHARIVNAIAQAPLRGTGYGTYAEIVRMHSGDSGTASPVERRNAYFESALEIGIPAALALVLSVGWVVVICFSSVLRHRRRAFLPCLGVAATVALGAHAALDGGILMPAVVATYAAILGAACAQAFRLEIPERRTGERRAGG